MNDLTLISGGTSYGGWESISFQRSMESLCGSFTIGITDKWTAEGEPWAVKEGDEIQLKIGSKLILSGFVDNSVASLDGAGNRINISGRDKTCDLVDCSAVNTPGSWKQYTFESIGKELCTPFGIKFLIDTGVQLAGDRIDFSIESGETVHEALERLSRIEGVLLSTNPEGDVLVLNVGDKGRAGSDLEYGVNVKAVEGNFDWSNRFSEYIIKGQSAGSGGGPWSTSETVQVSNKIGDPDITRHRPLQIFGESNSTNEKMKTRAQWEKLIRKARGFIATVTLAGWEMSPGNLWDTGYIVKTRVPGIGIDQDLLISQIVFNKSSEGTESVLKLVPPDSYSKEPEKVKSNKEPGGIAWR